MLVGLAVALKSPVNMYLRCKSGGEECRAGARDNVEANVEAITRSVAYATCHPPYCHM